MIARAACTAFSSSRQGARSAASRRAIRVVGRPLRWPPPACRLGGGCYCAAGPDRCLGALLARTALLPLRSRSPNRRRQQGNLARMTERMEADAVPPRCPVTGIGSVEPRLTFQPFSDIDKIASGRSHSVRASRRRYLVAIGGKLLPRRQPLPSAPCGSTGEAGSIRSTFPRSPSPMPDAIRVTSTPERSSQVMARRHRDVADLVGRPLPVVSLIRPVRCSAAAQPRARGQQIACGCRRSSAAVIKSPSRRWTTLAGTSPRCGTRCVWGWPQRPARCDGRHS